MGAVSDFSAPRRRRARSLSAAPTDLPTSLGPRESRLGRRVAGPQVDECEVDECVAAGAEVDEVAGAAGAEVDGCVAVWAARAALTPRRWLPITNGSGMTRSRAEACGSGRPFAAARLATIRGSAAKSI